MMKIFPLLLLSVATFVGGQSLGSAASAKNYQVTGPITSLTDTMIIVQKGDEAWEISRDTKTKADSELKVGQKVTVHYRMVATSVDVKTTGSLSEPSKKAAGNDKPSTATAANKTKAP